MIQQIFTAAWRPFLEPVNLHEPWQALLLMLPLIIIIALIYKALKLPHLDRLGMETVQLSCYILCLMGLAALTLHLLMLIA